MKLRISILALLVVACVAHTQQQTDDGGASDASADVSIGPGPTVDPNPGDPIPDGHPWVARTSGTIAELRGVWCSAHGEVVVAVGFAGTIVRSTNRGATWSPVPSPTALDLEAVWGSSPNDVYVVGDAGTILHSIDGAQSFTPIASTITRRLYTVWGSGPGNVFTAGYDDATIFRTRDGGKDWLPILTPGLTGIGKIWGTDATNVYANTAASILVSHDGDSFHLTVGSVAQQNRVWAAGSSDIVTVNELGIVTRYDEATDIAYKNWPTPMKTLLDVWGTSATDVYVVGSDGRIAHSIDRGGIWDVQTSATTESLWSIHGADGDVFAVGANGAIVQRSKNVGP